jgi:hypothetical protein
LIETDARGGFDSAVWYILSSLPTTEKRNPQEVKARHKQFALLSGFFKHKN